MDRFWHNGLQAGPTWPKMHGTKADWGGKKNSFRNCFAALGASGGHTGGPRGPPARPRGPHGTNLGSNRYVAITKPKMDENGRSKGGAAPI